MVPNKEIKARRALLSIGYKFYFQTIDSILSDNFTGEFYQQSIVTFYTGNSPEAMSESAALNSVLHTWQIVSHTRLTLDSIFAEFSPLSEVCWLLALLSNICQIRSPSSPLI